KFSDVTIMRTLLLFAITLLLALSFPLASAAAIATDAASGCGIVTSPVCWTVNFACFMATNDTSGRCADLTGITNRPPPRSEASTTTSSTCTNNGVITMVTVTGSNAYCVGDTCDNEGVLLIVSVLGSTESCKGSGNVACVGSTCVLPLPIEASLSSP